MKSNTRRLALTGHITLSGGWIGSAVAYLGLVIAAMTSPDPQTTQSVWWALNLIGWYVIVPLAVFSLLTRLLMALGTPWGLARHYWVLASLVLTVIAVGVLLFHMPSVSGSARTAALGQATDIAGLRQALRGEVLHAGLGLTVLLLIQALNVYKPRGLTSFGRRVVVASVATSPQKPRLKDAELRPAHQTPLWVGAVWIHAAVFAVALAVLHAAGVGLPQH